MNITHFPDLISYLGRKGLLDTNQNISCKILTGGVSNRTVFISAAGGDSFIVKQALAKLNVKEDWFSRPERIFVEARALDELPNLIPVSSIPAFIFEDKEQFILIMQAIPQPHENWKTQLLRGSILLDHVDQFARLLALIHSQTIDNDYYASLFGEKEFFKSLRMDAYYRFTATQVPEASEFLLQLISETIHKEYCLVHGDFSPKNVLVRDENLILLDYEVMHYGDGAFDIGFAMTHFLSKANHLLLFRGKFIEAARRFWKTYNHIAKINAEMEARAVRNTLACLLSRVRGKSPLEYLSKIERDTQLAICLKILPQLPRNMNHFIEMWETIQHE